MLKKDVISILVLWKAVEIIFQFALIMAYDPEELLLQVEHLSSTDPKALHSYSLTPGTPKLYADRLELGVVIYLVSWSKALAEVERMNLDLPMPVLCW